MAKKVVEDDMNEGWATGKQYYWRRDWRPGTGVWSLFFGLFVLIIGASWLGNSLGWWALNIPWLPLAVTLIGLSLVAGWLKRRYLE